MNFPFTEKIISEGVVERTFAKDINRDDLVWHRDRGDRRLVVVESVGWQFQMDNQLPINLEPGQELLVPAGNWHRVIKGSSPLRVIINKVAKIKESKMRITKTQLKQIIKEELFVEQSNYPSEGQHYHYNVFYTAPSDAPGAKRSDLGDKQEQVGGDITAQNENDAIAKAIAGENGRKFAGSDSNWSVTRVGTGPNYGPRGVVNVNESPSGEHVAQPGGWTPSPGELDTAVFQDMIKNALEGLFTHADEAGASKIWTISAILGALNQKTDAAAEEGM